MSGDWADDGDEWVRMHDAASAEVASRHDRWPLGTAMFTDRAGALQGADAARRAMEQLATIDCTDPRELRAIGDVTACLGWRLARFDMEDNADVAAMLTVPQQAFPYWVDLEHRFTQGYDLFHRWYESTDLSDPTDGEELPDASTDIPFMEIRMAPQLQNAPRAPIAPQHIALHLFSEEVAAALQQPACVAASATAATLAAAIAGHLDALAAANPATMHTDHTFQLAALGVGGVATPVGEAVGADAGRWVVETWHVHAPNAARLQPRWSVDELH